MTNLTAMIIATRDDVYVAVHSSDGKHGFVIELGEYHRPLLSSKLVFDSEGEALESAEGIIRSLKDPNTYPGYEGVRAR